MYHVFICDWNLFAFHLVSLMMVLFQCAPVRVVCVCCCCLKFDHNNNLRNVLTPRLLTSNLRLNDSVFIFRLFLFLLFVPIHNLASNTSNWTIVWIAVRWCTTWYASGNAWRCRNYEHLRCKYSFYYNFLLSCTQARCNVRIELRWRAPEVVWIFPINHFPSDWKKRLWWTFRDCLWGRCWRNFPTVKLPLLDLYCVHLDWRSPHPPNQWPIF